MIHPKVANLRKVHPGEAIRAEHYNALVDAMKMSFTGPNLQITGDGFFFRGVQPLAALKWVIVRPPIEEGGLSVMAEDAVRHPDYGVAGDNQGRWIGVSELPGTPGASTLTEYPVWPHRLTDHYVKYAWDGLTRVRATQILLAFFVDDAWYVHPDPPFIARQRPHVAIKTPCSPQEPAP